MAAPAPEAGWTTLLCGGLAAAMGGFYVLQGLFFPTQLAHPGEAPPWLAVVVGGVFVSGGVAAILTTERRAWARPVINWLSFLITSGLALTAAWVALGPGHHEIASPLILLGPQSAEVGGRVAFGIGGLLAALTAGLIAHEALRPGPRP
jgi:hypothetical protein